MPDSVDATETQFSVTAKAAENQSFFLDREHPFVAPDGRALPPRSTGPVPLRGRLTTTKTALDASAVAASIPPTSQQPDTKASTPPRNTGARVLFRDMTNEQIAHSPAPNGNNANLQKREFTPLLRSAMKKSHVDRFAAGSSTPSTKGRVPPPPFSPTYDIDNVSLEEFTSGSMDDITRASVVQAMANDQAALDSSELDNSTPFAGANGAANDKILTLRQQEEAINEIQKENFDLKLKIYFLQNMLKTTTPEEYSTTIQQNASMKAEQVKMRTELAKLQQKLSDSEEKITQITNDLASDLAKEALTKEERGRLDLLRQDNQKKEDELYDARSMIEKLREEMEEYKANLQESDEDGAKDMQVFADQLEDEIERLKEDNNSLSTELDARIMELDRVKGELKHAQNRIAELEDGKEKSGQIDARAEHIEDMTKQIDTLHTQLKQVQKERDKFDADAKQARQDLEILLSAESNVVQSSVEDRHSIAQLRKVNEKLVKELEITRNELREARQESFRNIAVEEEDSFERATTKLRIEDLESKASRMADMEKELERLRRAASSASDSKHQLEEYQRLLDEEAKMKEDAQRRVDKLSKANSILRKQLQEMQVDAHTSTTRFGELAEVHVAHAQMEKLRIESDRRQQELQVEMEKYQTELHNAMEELHKTKRSADIAKNMAKNKISTLTEELRNVRAARDEMEQDLAVAMSSEEASGSELTARHRGELKALALQIRFLKAKCQREQSFREDSAFMKQFFMMRISSFESCNKANLYMLQQMGIYPDLRARERETARGVRRPPPNLKVVATVVRAVVRMKKLQEQKAEQKKLKSVIARCMLTFRATKERA
ncbi:uncharacterized protein V1518DRAFT_409968 [Limtongia smithiae]|uniref:uncharacterized protein n=1 Tax=Limtongia smithiae TaxID=1125753 RepID=UPI0034CEC9F7